MTSESGRPFVPFEVHPLQSRKSFAVPRGWNELDLSIQSVRSDYASDGNAIHGYSRISSTTFFWLRVAAMLSSVLSA